MNRRRGRRPGRRPAGEGVPSLRHRSVNACGVNEPGTRRRPAGDLPRESPSTGHVGWGDRSSTGTAGGSGVGARRCTDLRMRRQRSRTGTRESRGPHFLQETRVPTAPQAKCPPPTVGIRLSPGPAWVCPPRGDVELGSKPVLGCCHYGEEEEGPLVTP